MKKWIHKFYWIVREVKQNLPSFENTSTSQRLRLPSTPTSWMATNWPTRGRAHVNVFVVPSSIERKREKKAIKMAFVCNNNNEETMKDDDDLWMHATREQCNAIAYVILHGHQPHRHSFDKSSLTQRARIPCTQRIALQICTAVADTNLQVLNRLMAATTTRGYTYNAHCLRGQ